MQRLKSLLFCLFFISLTLFVKANSLQKASDLYFEGKQQEALNEFIKISKTEGDREAFLNAIYIALELGQNKLAIDTASAALKNFPQDPTILEFTGQAYLNAGYYLNAENIFTRLVGQKTKTDFYYINLARAQIGLNMPKLAIKNLQFAAKSEDHTALANFLLGELYFAQKDYKKARTAYKKVLDYDNQFIEAKKKYAEVLFQLKDYKQAYKNYLSIRSVEPNDKYTNQMIEKIHPYLKKASDLNLPTEKETTINRHTNVQKPISFEGPLPTIRVGLGAKISGAPIGLKEIKFSPSHDFKITDNKGKILVNGKAKTWWQIIIENNKMYLVSPENKKTYIPVSVKIAPQSQEYEGHTTIIKDLLVGHGTTWITLQDNEYRGEIEFIYNKKINGIIPVNIVNIEEYVYGVVASEMPKTFPLEALKTQAVIARTYGIKALGKHKKWGYDVCDTQNCQVYGGVKAEQEKTNSATDATCGQILTYQDSPIEAVFSSNCGGYTQSSSEAGWSRQEYLKPVSDYQDLDENNLQPYHFKELLEHSRPAYSRFFKNISPATFRWTRVLEEKQLREVIKQKKDIGQITAIIPLKRGRSGYVHGVKIVGKKGTLTLTKEHEIKKYLATGMLRSTYFIVQPNYEKGEIKSFIFYGGGWGHGVGLCQTGSGGRASAGQDYKEILKHYYTDIDIQDIRTKKPVL
ncbi:MAG: SpoIID/LytB domain-containing protein [Elusimicrobiaceae bacterium]|nr:SpoIID/LytB domain-containing protein [Elusimicrobiaceae bacterium]